MNRALGFTLAVVICSGTFACSRSVGPPTRYAIILQRLRVVREVRPDRYGTRLPQLGRLALRHFSSRRSFCGSTLRNSVGREVRDLHFFEAWAGFRAAAIRARMTQCDYQRGACEDLKRQEQNPVAMSLRRLLQLPEATTS